MITVINKNENMPVYKSSREISCGKTFAGTIQNYSGLFMSYPGGIVLFQKDIPPAFFSGEMIIGDYKEVDVEIKY